MPNLAKYLPPLLLACASAGIAHAGDVNAAPRSVGTFVDDSVISGQVKTRLMEAEGIDAMKIDVDTRKGLVQLTGTVDDEADLQRAEHLARGVGGVTMVDNQLRVAD